MRRYGGFLGIRFVRRFRNSFRGRFARRIGVLFLLCVLLPVSLVGVYSISEVSGQLRLQSDKRLRHTSKALGLATLERLNHLSSELALEARRIRTGETSQANMRHFARIHVLPSARPDQADADWPAWNESQIEALDQGECVLGVVDRGKGALAVCLARRVDTDRDDQSLLVAEVSREYLWRPLGVSDMVTYWVLDPHRRVLYLSPPPYPSGVEDLAFSPTSGIPELGTTRFSGEAELATRSWNLFLRARFHSSDWSFVACEDRSEVLAPYAGFRRNLAMGLLLAFLFVSLITLTQVRRSLVPLSRLWAGTKRIAAGRFQTRVNVQSKDEFHELADSFNDMAERLGRQFRTLGARADIDQAILESLDFDQIADAVTSRVSNVVPCQASLALLRESKDRVRAFAWDVEKQERVPCTESSSGELTDMFEGVGTRTIALDGKPSRLWAALAARYSGHLLLVPARVEGRVEGAIGIVRADANPLSEEDVADLEQLATQISVGLAKSNMFQELKELHWGTLTALARTIDAKSPWTAGHSERVTRVSISIARRLGVDGRDLECLRRGALLHDIGKIGISQTILDAARQLTDEEMETMRLHPQLGARILEPIPAFRDALRIVTQHHERFDGKGYPMGLKGKHIDLHARILSVADAFDALSADRPYRRGMSRAMAIEEIEQNAGTQFDPEVVAAFLQVAREEFPSARLRERPSAVPVEA